MGRVDIDIAVQDNPNRKPGLCIAIGTNGRRFCPALTDVMHEAMINRRPVTVETDGQLIEREPGSLN